MVDGQDKTGASYRPVGRETLQEQIFSQLEERLLTGQFAPGEKLALRGLAAALGTSLMPVRDALQRLSSTGVVTAGPNRTLIVPQLSKAEVEEIVEVRRALECLAAERAARYATEAGLLQLSQCEQDIEDAANAGDYKAFLRTNWHFHLTLAEIGGSAMIVSLLKTVWLRLGPILRPVRSDRDSLLVVIPIHKNITAAISSRDPEAARRAIEEDLGGVWIMERFDEQVGGAA